MKHEITVNVNGADVKAEPNPLSNVRPWDSVSWVFQGLGSDQLPLILFREVRPLPSEAPGAGSRCEPLGPFESLATGGDWILGSGDTGYNGRFIYDIFTIDLRSLSITKLTWLNRLDGTENFGGLDKSGPPPG